MTNKSLILGIDTSNYTTSLSLTTLSGELVREKRRLLPVKLGAVGLRQSEALFHHMKHLPELFQELLEGIPPEALAAISCAVRPRPLEESYMPVFLGAKSYGETLAAALKIPCYGFSHQEGHLEAGVWSLQWQPQKPFLALHLSGGTTEVLRVIPQPAGYEIAIVGGTSDLSAGQFIDRIGVGLGLPFPAGPHLEGLANTCQDKGMEVPVSVKGSTISFSGPETFLQRQLKLPHDPGAIAKGLFLSIGKGLGKVIKHCLSSMDEVLLVGGVASNAIVKAALLESFKQTSVKFYFGVPKYCSDNAVGISLLGGKQYAAENSIGI